MLKYRKGLTKESVKAQKIQTDSAAFIEFKFNLWITVPLRKVARRFGKFTAPLIAKVKINSIESLIFATQFTTLLSKLLNAKIGVVEATQSL